MIVSSKSKTIPWPYMVIIGIALYLLIDVLLAYLRPNYSVLHNAESDYGRGPYFWIMDINFLLRCIFSLALVKAIWVVFHKDIAIKKASYWLVVWSVASGLLAFFADNPYGYTHLWSGSLHLFLAFIAFISVLIGMISLNRQFRNIKAWDKTVTLLLAITIIAIISILLLGHASFKPHSLGGLYERFFLGSVLAWETIVARKIIYLANL